MTRSSIALGFVLVVILPLLDPVEAADLPAPGAPTITVYKGPT